MAEKILGERLNSIKMIWWVEEQENAQKRNWPCVLPRGNLRAGL
jgi:hypothetical protein